MLYATGDCHGNWTRLDEDNFPEQKEMTRSDYVVVLGDFGIWDNGIRENKWFDWLDAQRFTTLFVDGNHENYDILDRLPDIEWNGGIVHKIRPNIIHLMRGQLYNIDGRKIFSFGGARSHDISDGILDPSDSEFQSKKKWLDINTNGMYRINHLTWWEREMPSKQEMDNGIANLEKNNCKVDYIFSHCASTSIQSIMGAGLYKPDILTDYFEEIISRCDFKAWLFGHMHVNRKIMDKHYCLYEQITRIW